MNMHIYIAYNNFNVHSYACACVQTFCKMVASYLRAFKPSVQMLASCLIKRYELINAYKYLNSNQSNKMFIAN